MMDPEEFRKKCKGIIPVQYCPYKENGDLDIEGLKRNTEFLVEFAEKGKDLVIMTNGSTTEFYANSIKEQKLVIKTVVETADGKVPVVAGTSQAGTRETIKMTRYAEEVGADCAMVVLPFYHTPTKEGMYQHYRKVADAVKIAIMIYNNPAVSGALIDPWLMKRLAEIDNIVAVKDNTPNAAEYAWKAALIKEEDMALICGLGELHYLGAAAYGYRGFVTFVGNFAPALSYELYEAASKGGFNKAMEALKKQMPLWSLMGKFMSKRKDTSIIPVPLRANYMYMGIGKYCMDLVGLHGGPLRLPMDNLTESEKGEVKKTLQEMGLI